MTNETDAMTDRPKEREEPRHFTTCLHKPCCRFRAVGPRSNICICGALKHEHGRTPSTETDAPTEGENRKAGVKDAEDLQRRMDKMQDGDAPGEGGT